MAHTVTTMASEQPTQDGEPTPKAFGTTRYWDERYMRDKEPFDWYARYDALEGLIAAQAAGKDVEILHLGCGTSRLGEALCGAGYKYVMNIDISRACVIAQLERYASGPHRNNKFMHGNACALEFPDESFDLVIAKATLDVIRCGKGAEGNVHAVCREVSRVLRPGGRFLVVSHADDWEEVLEAVSERDAGDARRAFGWTLERAKVPKPQTDPRHPDGAVLHVYIATRDPEDERPSLASLKGVGQKVSSLAALGALRPLANAPA